MEPLLQVRDLSIRFHGHRQVVQAVEALSYTLAAGETLAIIGESGCGKTTSSRALTGLLPANATVTGSIRFAGTELVGIPEREIRRYRGASIAMVFQDTSRALNPTMRVGRQITETLRLHRALDRTAAQEQAIDLLSALHIHEPRSVFKRYPHELSGGMRQRVVIAIALSGNPKLLIVDEATRSLDVINQVETLRLLKSVQRQMGMAIIVIAHDLRQVTHFADNVLVMHSGRAIEYLPASELHTNARAHYTQALVDAMRTR